MGIRASSGARRDLQPGRRRRADLEPLPPAARHRRADWSRYPLIVGPLSFVGLMAPHMARMMGLQRPMPQLYGAAVIGAPTMFPRRLARSQPALPLPAGLLATFIGGPYFMKLMAKSGR